MSRQRRFTRSIRFKLLLVSLSLLAIPWAGYRYIQETERFLRQTQETLLMGIAQAVAAILHEHPAIAHAGPPGGEQGSEPLIYINPLAHPIQVDGYSEDWRPYLGNLQRYPEQGEALFEGILGEYGDHLYLLLRVSDSRVIYQPPGSRRLDLSDYVELVTGNGSGPLRRYRITTSSPGWVPAYLMPEGNGQSLPVRREERIRGEWQTQEGGYTLELRIPRYLLGDHFAVSVSDLDDPERPASRRQVSSASPGPARMVRPDPAIERLIGGLEHENARIWVLNEQRQVLAMRGRLQEPEAVADELPAPPGSPLRPLLRLVLDQPSAHFEDEFSRRGRLKGPEIDSALAGQADQRRRGTPDGRAVILSVASPVRAGDRVVGAILVEQSTNRILSLQNQAMEQITGTTLALFLVVGLAILGFATRLTGRIRRLRNRVESAVSDDGRIRAPLGAESAADEIGDLGRSFSSVLDRLAEYNRYLEEMASRLAHEFRTPLTIVRTSLENLQGNPLGDDHPDYIRRAQEGIQRLDALLNRMREATRLEQQLQHTEMELFRPDSLLQSILEGYRQAFPGVVFELQLPAETVTRRGAPELVVQALDKLVSNAVDFQQAGTPIRLILSHESHRQYRISISNQGPTLPEGMQRELFASMVSVRRQKSDQPHLGLGLYLVRLICEFHGGHAEACNLPDGTGVVFSLVLPNAGK
ncbi:MAG: proteobacterial dedicated sortase system histidine kinase [Sedimenticola sp.]|nr:proteobacterial dedicated sortase system histidine kinase [Sedimenticola sp.]